MTGSLRALLAGAVDYAGLFPPAALSMENAEREYTAARQGRHAWMLGRFVAPVARLPEIAGDFPLSVVADFPGGAADRRINAWELKGAPSPAPSGVEAYFEMPAGTDPVEFARAVKQAGGRAKIRTGGVTAEAFPTRADIARFLGACREAGIAFKATAGLHHPVCGVHPLTCESSSPTARMHGFLNVLLAAAFIFAGGARRAEIPDLPDFVSAILNESSALAFGFTDDGISWRDHRITTAQVALARRDFAISFGSCSFREPVAELKQLGLL